MSTEEMAMQAICFAAERVANRIDEVVKHLAIGRRMVSNLDLPSVRFRPKLSRDGNKWIALYGDNLQVGVVGVGDSPGAAMREFDIEWDKQIVARHPRRAQTQDCGWVYSTRHDCYSTGCGEEVDLSGLGTMLEDVQYVYCPHCGGKIVEEQD